MTKTEFIKQIEDLLLDNPSKLTLIKAIKTISGLGFKESKDIADMTYKNTTDCLTIAVDTYDKLKETVGRTKLVNFKSKLFIN